MTDSVLAYSSAQTDLHLQLSAGYATRLADKLGQRAVHVAPLPEDDWDDFRAAAGAGTDQGAMVAFFTHGALQDSKGHCTHDCQRDVPAGRCSCYHGARPDPLITLEAAGLLAGTHIYGATACHAAILLGPVAVAFGALSFAGYTGLFLHTKWRENGTNPFEDIVNSYVLDVACGVPPSEAADRVRRRYDDWIRKDWGTSEPGDWTIVEACLRHDRGCFVSL